MELVQVQQPILASNCVRVGSVFIEECRCVRNCQLTLRRSLSYNWTLKNEQLHPESNRKCQGTLLCCHIIGLMMSGHIWWWLKHKVLKRWWQCFCITNQCRRSNYKQRRWREWHWLLKVYRMRHVICINCMELIVKCFFLTGILLRAHLWFG
jgi:hypothetical protein